MPWNIDREPAFCWWVPCTLRPRDRIVTSVRACARKMSHKYEIEIPRTVEEAYEIYEKNSNTIWRDVINKEMENLKVAVWCLTFAWYLNAKLDGPKMATEHLSHLGWHMLAFSPEKAFVFVFLRCIEWISSPWSWHTECISASPFFWETLHNLWCRVWVWKCE